MKGYIYLIENKINGKKYIGKTYNSIAQRWNEHKRESKRSIHRPLYKAMNKYGIENFEIKEIEYCDNCEEREQYWIKIYNTYENGYNATLGGDGKTFFNYSDEEVIRYYKQIKSIKETAKYFNCDFETIRKRLVNNQIDISENIYSEKKNWKALKIGQYSLAGEYIQDFKSILQAANWIIDNNLSKGQRKHIVSNISKNCRGKENRKQAYGFIWKIKE